MSDKILNYLTSGNDVNPDRFIEFLINEPDCILQNGLEENTINAFIDFFTSKDLSNNQMCLVLECVLPKTVICKDKVKKLLYWLFSYYSESPSKAVIVIDWLEAMVKYNLVNIEPLEVMYDFMMNMLKCEQLIHPLSKLLVLLTKPCMVSESNVYLLNKFYDSSPSDIDQLLKVYHTMKPSITPLPRNIKKGPKAKPTKFEEIIKVFATKTGRKCIINGDETLSSAVPAPEYDSSSTQNVGSRKISDIVGMYDLGQNMCRIQLPDDELSLLSSNEGVMYVIANGPSQKFLTSVDIKLQNNPSEAFLITIVGLQEQLMHGLPPVLNYLSNFLLVWDGIYRDQIVLSLIPWLHFNDFEDLKRVLAPLASVYISSDAKFKLKIIDSLIFLITHMTCVHWKRYISEKTARGFTDPNWLSQARKVIRSVCDVVHSLLSHGILLEGFSCISLTEKSIEFYDKLIYLQDEFGLFNFIIPLPQVIYSALFSANHQTVSNLCSLIFKYKSNAIPCITSAFGLTEEVQSQIKFIELYSSNIYSYLWGNKDAQQILDSVEDSEHYIVKNNIGIHHLGLYPLIKQLSIHLKLKPERLSEEQIMLLYQNYAKGIDNFVKFEMEESKPEEAQEDSAQELEVDPERDEPME